MITRKQLDEKLSEITEKCTIIANSLESLYQSAVKLGNDDFAKQVERIQFDGYFNPSCWSSDYIGGIPGDFKIFYEILEENELSKINIDEIKKLKMKLKQIENIINA